VVVDDLTVVYRLTQPNAAFADVLSGAVGWVFNPAAADAAGADAGANPVGTGPFVFGDWQRDSRLTVTKNPNYWREGLPYLDEIVFRPIPDEDTRISSLASGDIDVLQSLRQSAIRQVQDLDGVESHEHLGNNSGSSIFNTTRPPLDDVRVRQAIAYALNQEELIEVLGGTGLTPPHTQYFSPDSPWYSEGVAAAWPTNEPDRARELLDEYVNDPNRSDGKAPGSPVTFQYDCPPDPSLIELSQVYQAQWGAVGFEVNLNQVEQATHVSEAIAGDYDAKCWRVGSEQDPYRVFNDAFSGDSPLNFTNFTHPDIDEALEVLRTTTDVEPRKEAVEQIGMVIAENVPNTFTAGTLTTLAGREYVQNIPGWTFPSGDLGEGVINGYTMWAEVWREG
jgi:peptide/nickel transport system substrate-binding protein